MRILVLGNGAREDALSWRLSQSPSTTALFHAPGNAGTATRGENIAGLAVTDARSIVERAQALAVDLVVIGPETSIAAGLGDRLRDAGIATFGPNRGGGRLETSKIYAKRFMERHSIPTARFKVVHSFDGAANVLEDWQPRGVVVKADGLAGGKGVVVAPDCQTAVSTLRDWYERGVPGGGSDVVLEEPLSGREVSVFAVSDGRAMIPVVAACDYKRAGDGDAGPNTGGMGAYSPPVDFPPDLLAIVREAIVGPTLRGLLAEGEDYRGVLYVGIMWTADGPAVIEYNARWGDPETQVLMPRFSGDFARYLKTAADGAVQFDAVSLSTDTCVGITLATKAYPYENTPVRGMPAQFDLPPGVVAFWGASTRNGDTVDSPGGRVLTIVARGAGVEAARRAAYDAVAQVKPQIPAGIALTYRSDIASIS